MKMPIPFAVLAGIWGFLAWIERGNGGKVGTAVRRSTHEAWRGAVEDLENELTELRRHEPPRS